MKVCVFGSTGFVGRHLLRALLQEQHAVQALARPSSDLSWLPAAGTSAGDVRWVRGDLADYPSVEAAVGGCELVYNLAVPVRTADARTHHAVNVLGVENVLRAARVTGASHMVHCSTVAVHGKLREVPANEGHPLAPKGPYPASKVAGEKLVLEHVRKHGMSSVIARLPSVYGPGGLRTLKVFRAVLAGPITTLGSAGHLADFTYVSDIVDGLLRCGRSRAAPGEVYILASGAPRPYVDFLRAIAAAARTELRLRRLPVLPFRAVAAVTRPLRRIPGIEWFQRRMDGVTAPQAYDISKARRELGYCPTISLEEGARRTLHWYRENGYLPVPGGGG